MSASQRRGRGDQAMQTLRRSMRPIEQVAMSVGFRREKSFSRAFKGMDRGGAGGVPAQAGGSGRRCKRIKGLFVRLIALLAGRNGPRQGDQALPLACARAARVAA